MLYFLLSSHVSYGSKINQHKPYLLVQILLWIWNLSCRLFEINSFVISSLHSDSNPMYPWMKSHCSRSHWRTASLLRQSQWRSNVDEARKDSPTKSNIWLTDTLRPCHIKKFAWASWKTCFPEKPLMQHIGRMRGRYLDGAQPNQDVTGSNVSLWV